MMYLNVHHFLNLPLFRIIGLTGKSSVKFYSVSDDYHQMCKMPKQAL